MEESNIAKQFLEERKGNFSFRRPRTVKESIKLKEDRKIRQQQEEEFFKACQPKKEEPPLPYANSPKPNDPQKKEERKQEIVPKPAPKK